MKLDEKLRFSNPRTKLECLSLYALKSCTIERRKNVSNAEWRKIVVFTDEKEYNYCNSQITSTLGQKMSCGPPLLSLKSNIGTD